MDLQEREGNERFPSEKLAERLFFGAAQRVG
jgi:hypothetical protein